MRAAQERFWAKVEKTDQCWNWVGSLIPSGYGHFTLRTGVQVLAHRLSYEMYRGPIPKNLLVCHSCDNRRCVRPDHLFLGTHQDNMDDAIRKGRFRTGAGERHALAKVDEARVRQIRLRYQNGESMRQLAKQFGITRVAIRFIVRRMTWKHMA